MNAMNFAYRVANNNTTVLPVLMLISLLTVHVTGCKKPSGTIRVHGRLSYQTQPLDSAAITFFPATGRPTNAPAPHGEYATELAPGDYTVVVEVGTPYPPGFKEGDPIPPPKFVLPDEYTTRARSTLKATVKAGEDKPIDFDLK
jgi:hypothetical protein